MKSFYQKLSLVFILVILLDYKYLYPYEKKYNYNDEYITYLEDELNDLKVIKNYNLNQNLYYGKVIGQNPYHFKKELNIKVSNNIKINSLVIDENGLVGKVLGSYQNLVIAGLLTNEKVITQIVVNDCDGILNYNGNNLVIKGINYDCNININDVVYTSNYENKVKYKVGKIIKINDNKNSLNKEYIIDSFSNLKPNYVLLTGEK